MKSKPKEVTRIGALASQCCNGNIHVVVPKSWKGLRIFCIIKSQWDQVKREEERRITKMVGTMAASLIKGGKNGC